MPEPTESQDPGSIALITAAGFATRLPDVQSSKELIPVRLRSWWRSAGTESEPVICHFLRALRPAKVIETRIVLRVGKWDIPEHLSHAEWDDLKLQYRITPGTSGVPESVTLGLADRPDAHILFGFPDVLFEPADAFAVLASRLKTGNADVVLGAFPTGNPSKMDMVQFDSDGRVTEIDIKPEKTSLQFTWILAAWRSSFTHYLLDLSRNDPDRIEQQASRHADKHIGHLLQLAMQDGLRVEAVPFEEGRSLDIGTPEDLGRADDWYSEEPQQRVT